MIIAYKYKLKPSHSQQQIMRDWLNMLRANYNYCLADRINSYEQVTKPKRGNYCDIKTKGECCPLTCSISRNSSIGEPFKKNGKKRGAYEQQSSQLPRLKKSRPWYATIHSTVLQQNLRRLDSAFKNFFQGKGYPKYKTRQRFRSFHYPPNQVIVDGNGIYLPKIGWMRYFQSRKIANGFTIKGVTVRKKADGWYVILTLEDKSIPDTNNKDIEQINSVIGVDLGIKKLLSLSNGETISNPQFEKKLEKRKTLLQRRVSRKKRGSNNQRKALQKVARIDQKIVNQRENYQWNIAHKLNQSADVIVLEDLNVKGMIRKCRAKQDDKGKYLKNGQSAKKGLNRLIRDCSWGNLVQKIESVAEKFGSIVLKVNPKFTSQKCTHCGHTEKENRKKERFLCLNCGFLADADIQAAENIGKKGLEILGLSPSKLLRDMQKVTTTSESTGATSDSGEKSMILVVEPSNSHVQLNLFEWMNGQVIGC